MNIEKLKRIAYRRALLKAKGLKYEDFGVDKSIVWRVINETQPNQRVRVKIARRLRVRVGDLFPPDNNIARNMSKRNTAAGR